MSDSHHRLYEFGGFLVDAGKGVLLRDGDIVPMTPKMFDTLLALVEHNGRVMTKDELMNIVWPDTMVEENNLTQYISALRRILSEGQNGTSYIQTLPKRGYRFVASICEHPYEEETFLAQKLTRARIIIEETEESVPDKSVGMVGFTESLADSEPFIKAGPKLANPVVIARSWLRNQKLLTIAVALLLIIGGISIGSFIFHSPNNTPRNVLASLRLKPLVSWKSEAGEGSEGARFSPNGQMIAYSLIKYGQRNIWTKQLPDGRPNAITDGKWNYYSPIWSPDSLQIAFVSNRENQTAIWSVPFSGGPLKLIKPIDSSTVELKHWSKDGESIYYRMGRNIFLLQVRSGQITQLTNFDADSTAQFFSISPKEDYIAYSSKTDTHRHLFALPIGDTQAIQVTTDEADDEYPIWFHDGKRILYSSNRGGTFQTCVAYIGGGKTEQLNLDISDNLAADISPDDSSLLFTKSRDDCDLWLARVDKKEEVQITSDFGIELWCNVSPDNQSLVYQATTEAKHLLNGSILIRDASNQESKLAANGFNPTFSPDSSKVAFLRFADKQITLWTVSRIGANEKQIMNDSVGVAGYTQMPYNLTQTTDYCWTPDSSSLVYYSKKSGLWDLWKVAADGSGEPQQITHNTDDNIKLFCPIWSPDGTILAHLSSTIKPPANSQQVTNLCLTTQQKSEIIFSSTSQIRLLGWTPHNDYLILAMLEDKNDATPSTITLWQVSVAGNNRHHIAQIEVAYFNNLRLSPDGRKIAFVSRADGRDNLYVLSMESREMSQLTTNLDGNLHLSGIAWSPDGKAIYYCKQRREGLISLIENFK